jgi:hypothetical protein
MTTPFPVERAPFLPPGRATHISTIASHSLGGGAYFSLSTASAVWPTDDSAIFIPFRLSLPQTLTMIGWRNGTAVSGNVDAGVYTGTTKIISTGATAQAGTSAVQSVAVTDTILGPGEYLMALCCDNTTAAFSRYAPAQAVFLRFMGIRRQTGITTLPATTSLVSATAAYIPLMFLGFGPRTLI